MIKHFFSLIFIASALMILPTACQKSQSPDPGTGSTAGNNNNNNNNPGGGGNNNPGGGNNNGNNPGGGGNPGGSDTIGTVYFRATINGTKMQWSDAEFPFRTAMSRLPAANVSDLCNNINAKVTAGFTFWETYRREDVFGIDFTGCSNLRYTYTFGGNCEEALDWLERVRTLPTYGSETTEGAYLELVLPTTKEKYITTSNGGTVSITKVEVIGTGSSYDDPKYMITGTFKGELQPFSPGDDRIMVNDGEFRVYIGACVD